MKATLLIIISLLYAFSISAQESMLAPPCLNIMYEVPSLDESKDLQFLREEELLAGDVYRYFYKLYPMPFFLNISKSEDAHTASIKYILDKYSLSDPALDHEEGVYKSTDLQKLYNDLINKGSVSIIEAIRVSALIEEIDIVDLTDAIERVENNDDIVFVYTNLRRASGNHLRVFTKQLKARGVTYSPSHLSQEEYVSIVR